MARDLSTPPSVVASAAILVLFSLVVMVAVAGCRTGGGGESIATLERAAGQQLEQGNIPEALKLVRQARARSLVSADPLGAARLRLLEAEILILSQLENEALSLLAPGGLGKEAAALAAREAMLTGMALRRKGNWPEARAKLEWALAKAHDEHDRPTEVKAGVQLAAGLFRRLEWDPALDVLKRSAAVAAQLGDAYLKISVRFNQASLFMRRGEPDRSTELYKEVVNDLLRHPNPVLMASALDDMAQNYLRVGDYERALEMNARALAEFAKLDLPRDTMQTRGLRGRLLLELDRPEEGAAELEKAVQLARQRSDPEQLRRWSGNLTIALLALNRLDEAERLSNEMLATDPTSAYLLANRSVILERRGRLAEARQDWRTVMANPQCPPEIYREAEFGMARLHAAANERALAIRRYQAALQLVDQGWASLRTEDSRLTFLNGVMEIYRSYAGALTRWQDERGALAVEESSRARLLGAAAHAGRPELGAAASIEALTRLASRTDSIFLAYWVAPNGGSHVRVIGGGRSERVPLEALNPRDLNRLVREHNDLIERQIEDPREKGKAALELYNLLIGPVASRIPAGAHVVLIPDGALHRLNFESLVRVKDGHNGFWIEDVTLQVAPSLTLLTEQTRLQPPASARRQTALLIGNALPAPDFGRLEHAAAEMRIVRSIFDESAVTSLEGSAATVSSYAAASPGSRSYLHFTAHAQANFVSPLDSAVILTPEELPNGERRHRLLARDVAAIALQAELVTVSACRSAGDRAVLGEGMVGFAWAFQRAGARNVVAGLWDVNDRSTTQLMEKLYAGIHAGKPPTEALREAKLSFIRGGRNYAKPYYWAPFQVYSRNLFSVRVKRSDVERH